MSRRRLTNKNLERIQNYLRVHCGDITDDDVLEFVQEFLPSDQKKILAWWNTIYESKGAEPESAKGV